MPKSALKIAGEAEILTSDAFLALFFLCFVNQFLDSLLNPPDPGPNYAKFMEEFCLKKAEGFSVLAIEVIEAADQPDAAGSGNNNGNTSKRILPDAYGFFNTFKRLFVDLILSFHDRDKSRYYFQNQNLISKTAFEVSQLISCVQYVVSEVVYFLLPSNKKRWSNSMPQYNLLSFSLKDKRMPCLDDKPELFQKIVRHSPIFYKTFGKSWYKSRSKISTELKDFIFQHFLKKSRDAKSAKTAKDNTSSLCSARGNLVFEEYERSSSFNWTTEVEFDHSILIWHIATDLCCHSNGGKKLAAKNLRCKGSKNLSDYMLYLLVMCPFLSPIGIGMIRFQDTCEEAKHFFQEKGLSKNKVEFCKILLKVNTDVEPIRVKGDRSKSVLFNANKLAKQLQEMGEEKNWELFWEFVTCGLRS
uniref:DUF4220 domain-containing protein n=1 Tax=Quercus lobata TaxID=97700 RepID=A0A7N2KTM0_QUELO